MLRHRIDEGYKITANILYYVATLGMLPLPVVSEVKTMRRHKLHLT